MYKAPKAEIADAYDDVIAVIDGDEYALSPALAYSERHCRRHLAYHGIRDHDTDGSDYDIRITAGDDHGILPRRPLIGSGLEHGRGCLDIGPYGRYRLIRELRLYR